MLSKTKDLNNSMYVICNMDRSGILEKSSVESNPTLQNNFPQKFKSITIEVKQKEETNTFEYPHVTTWRELATMFNNDKELNMNNRNHRRVQMMIENLGQEFGEKLEHYRIAQYYFEKYPYNEIKRFILEKQLIITKRFRINKGNITNITVYITYLEIQPQIVEYIKFKGEKRLGELEKLFTIRGSHADKKQWVEDKAKYLLSLSEESLRYYIQTNNQTLNVAEAENEKFAKELKRQKEKGHFYFDYKETHMKRFNKLMYNIWTRKKLIEARNNMEETE
jgi:Fe-S cluster biosynthesis and repair protein YggX